MRLSFWNKKIPTILGMLIIVVGLSITTLLTGKTTLLETGAQGNNQPQDVRISNITNKSFGFLLK